MIKLNLSVGIFLTIAGILFYKFIDKILIDTGLSAEGILYFSIFFTILYLIAAKKI